MTPAQINAKATDVLQRAVQPAGCDQRPGQRGAEQSAGGQLHAQRHGERHRADDVHQAPRPDQFDARTAPRDVKWGVKKLELALVLDNTGSMASNGKMTELKTAAKNLLTTLKNAAKQPGDVKVVDHSRSTPIVNIGTVYKDEFWIDYHGAQYPEGAVAGLRAGPRPAERHARHGAGLGQREHAVPGQQCSVAHHDHAADRRARHDRLYQSQQQDRRDERRRATPTSRSAWCGAGIR